jgi:hypothetical protein
MNAYNYAPNEIGVSDAMWFKTNAVVYDPLLVIGSNVLLGIIDKTDDAQDALTSSNGINYVEIDNINNFSGGSVAINVSRAAFLDVSLTSFEVEKYEQTKSLLAWSTEREENMLGFHVERSTDGIHFERIGIVYPQGGLNQSVSYSFVDHSPLMGSNYYRLAMEEISGHIDYTLTKVVEFVGDYDNIRVQPNPFEDLVDLKVDVLAKEEITIRVYNSIGKQVYYMRRQLDKGSNTLTLEFDKNLASGAYWLQYDNGSYTQHKKIIKQ